MSREVRRVPMDWQHPTEWRPIWDPAQRRARMQHVFKPLLGRSYAQDAAAYADRPEDFEDDPPDPTDYMPEFNDVDPDTLGYCMYESVTEGTPISPVFQTPEELAHWLADTEASAMGLDHPTTYERWLAVARGGWAPSMIATGEGIYSGVDGLAILRGDGEEST